MSKSGSTFKPAPFPKDKEVAHLIGQLFGISNTVWIFDKADVKHSLPEGIQKIISFKTVEDAEKFIAEAQKQGGLIDEQGKVRGIDGIGDEALFTLKIEIEKMKDGKNYPVILLSERGYKVIVDVLSEVSAKAGSSTSLSAGDYKLK